MEILGKSPIPLPLLILGKLGFAGCWLFFIVEMIDGGMAVHDSALTSTIGIVLSTGGVVLLLLALFNLGRSAAVGIPVRMTQLRTGGLYRISRNPVYVGAFLTCVGSCLYCLHPVNFLLCAMSIAIHHRIVMAEERFLEGRFGQQWVEYQQRVPRYLGRVKRHSTPLNRH